MKFIHTADWHIGKLFYGEYLTEEQEWILKNRFLPLVDDEKPDVVLLAGDVYDRSVPPSEAVELLDEMIYEIVGRRKIPFIVISGNHDSSQRLSFGGRLMESGGLFMVGDIKRSVKPIVLEDEWGAVVFAPIPYAEPGTVRTVMKDETVKTHEEAVLSLSNYLLSKIDKNIRKIAITHEFVAGGSTSDSERPLSIGGTDLIRAEIFKPYNYTALGHLHSPQRAGFDNVRYSGSLLKYSFSEVTQKKGVIVGELSKDGEVKTKFVPLKPRRDVRIISGLFEDLMKNESLFTDDFLQIELTNDGPVIDAMARLRTHFPYVMALQTKKRVQTGEGARNFDFKKRVNPIDMMKTFVDEFRDEPMNKTEAEYMQKIFEELKGGEFD